MNKKLFTCGNELSFVGFSNGKTWNGFDCPYFEFEECEKIMNSFNKENEKFDLNIKIIYDSTNDCFIEQDENYDEDEYVIYESLLIETSEGTKKVYPIGNCYWTWEAI
jgi:hypothetical protein